MSGFQIDLLSAAKQFKSVYGTDPILSNLLGQSNSKPLSSNEMDEFNAPETHDKWSADDQLVGALALMASSPTLGGKIIAQQAKGQASLDRLSMLLASLQQSGFNDLVAGPQEPQHDPSLDVAAQIEAKRLEPYTEIRLT